MKSSWYIYVEFLKVIMKLELGTDKAAYYGFANVHSMEIAVNIMYEKYNAKK